MTTSPVMTVTDELLADIEAAAGNAHIARSGHDWFSSEDCHWWTGNADEGDFISMANPATITALTTELRRLRAENAELERVVKDVRWRVADTTDQLQSYGFNGDRLYGLDEWSVPIRNLNIAIGMLEKATK